MVLHQEPTFPEPGISTRASRSLRRQLQMGTCLEYTGCKGPIVRRKPDDKAEIHRPPSPFFEAWPLGRSAGARRRLTSAWSCRPLRCGLAGRGPHKRGQKHCGFSCSPSPECFWQICDWGLLSIGGSQWGRFLLINIRWSRNVCLSFRLLLSLLTAK